MKKLYILRHAKSDWSDPNLDDFDRGLKKRGKNDIKLISNWLKEQGIQPNIIISSPAKRAKKNFKSFEKYFTYKKR